MKRPLLSMMGALITMVPGLADAQTPGGDPVLQSLAAGDQAIVARDYTALLRSAQMLGALGATPAEGESDVAAQWMDEAKAHGAVASTTLAYRGRVLGPAYRRGSLSGGASFTMTQLFLAGQRAQISVAEGLAVSGALSVKVKGADGGTLCEKPVGVPQADCAWLPVFTDRFDIVIQNAGAQPAAFYLTMR